MNYYTSDPHFGHANIIKFCDRPWKDVSEMDEALIKNWNDTVTDEDHVYILGDICMNKNKLVKILERLNGFIHIVAGNHDVKNLPSVLKHMKGKVFIHPLIHTVKDEGRKVVLCHFPIYEWNGYYHGVVHFHGHTHGSIGDNFRPNAFDVGVDSREYRPMTYDEIVGSNYSKFNFGKGEYANKTNKPEDNNGK